MSVISIQVSSILKDYSSDQNYEYLREAKDIFQKLTSTVDEDSFEYESRMNCFNDWFVFNHKLANNKKIFEIFFDTDQIDSELSHSFHNVNYSVFKVLKVNDKKIEMLDILHNEKMRILTQNSLVSFVAEDIFVGRVVKYQGKSYLLKGVCTLPREATKPIIKVCEKIRKKRAYQVETDFLLNLEKLKMKSLNYKHLRVDQVFQFENLKL